ncbi:MAG: pyridoxamine 5'-phosphate oxidase family protein [Egibacteraceae bacterium]
MREPGAEPYNVTMTATGSHKSYRKARNVAARPEVTVLVGDRETLQWVSATGTAELRRGDQSRERNTRVYRRWMTGDGLKVVGRVLQEVEDVTIVVTPERWIAWDMESSPPCGTRGYRWTSRKDGSCHDRCLDRPRREARGGAAWGRTRRRGPARRGGL